MTVVYCSFILPFFSLKSRPSASPTLRTFPDFPMSRFPIQSNKNSKIGPQKPRRSDLVSTVVFSLSRSYLFLLSLIAPNSQNYIFFRHFRTFFHLADPRIAFSGIYNPEFDIFFVTVRSKNIESPVLSTIPDTQCLTFLPLILKEPSTIIENVSNFAITTIQLIKYN